MEPYIINSGDPNQKFELREAIDIEVWKKASTIVKEMLILGTVVKLSKYIDEFNFSFGNDIIDDIISTTGVILSTEFEVTDEDTLFDIFIIPKDNKEESNNFKNEKSILLKKLEFVDVDYDLLHMLGIPAFGKNYQL